MFDRIPISYFLAKRSSWALVSRNGGQGRTPSGREPEPQRAPVRAARCPAWRGRDFLGFSMDLLEYQGKQLFGKHGVPVPEGRPAASVEEAVAAAEELGYPVVIKAQVLIGGRGKAGGIKLANDRAEAEEHAQAILGMDIRGLTVHELYVEKASEIAEEYYAAVLLDRGAKRTMAMLSRMGGMDVEEIAEKDQTAIARLHVDPLIGFHDFP